MNCNGDTMRVRKFRRFMADFETTVYKGQTYTEVWAAAIVEIGSNDVKVFHSIEDFHSYILTLDGNICIYFHNLKFDGSFILDYFMRRLQYKEAGVMSNGQFVWLEEKNMRNNSFKYAISTMGQWYSIQLKEGNRIIEYRDSLKLLPFTVKQIGQSFKTEHQKLEMEYEGERYAGCVITPEEEEYIKNDVLVMKEALEILFGEGHDKLTIGSCCLNEFKMQYNKVDYKEMFPDLKKYPLDKSIFGSSDADEYIRKSYKGGWCYLVPQKAGKLIERRGLTLDVNSLYPSVMSSESGSRYPVGEPNFWAGSQIPKEALKPWRYYFVRFRCRFYIKPGFLPFVQIKNSPVYKANECLESSDVVYEGKKYKFFELDGELKSTALTLTMTCTDYELFLEHYDTEELEILDGCWFEAEPGIFDGYIRKYKKQKLESKGARRQLAKLFLNNLYGKMAASDNSSFKHAFFKQDGNISFEAVLEHKKRIGYIPVGSAITSYARNFTIRAAQSNFYGGDKPGFIYSDTDSIHLDLPLDKVKGVELHDKDFCKWKCENEWQRALFVRQKTYIEVSDVEDGEKLPAPKNIIKCAGMPAHCKELFNMSVTGINRESEVYKKLKDQEKQFVDTKRELTDFKIGLTVPGKLLPKRIIGGVVLTDTTFEMR